jgi:hypothetical protein
MKEHELGRANAVAETPTNGCLDRRMKHITPLVAQEAKKGCMTTMQGAF